MTTNYRHYLFEDPHTGEQIIVGATTVDKAAETAEDFFGPDALFVCRLSEFEAEASGLDEI